MDDNTKHHLFALLVGVCLLFMGGNVAAVAAMVCDTQQEAAPVLQQDSAAAEAIFDYFSYEGQDDFYKEHPLPDASAFYNPILPGWYSDPSICTNGEGDYFLVTSTFTYFPGVPLFHSRDLVNWRQVGHVLSRPSQLQRMAGQHVSGGIFAPAIAYNPHNKTYYMITTNVGAGTFFVKTDDPFGEWSDPIMLPAVKGIDPSFFFDNDGKGYIVYNDDAPDNNPEYPGHRTIRLHAFDVDGDTTIGEEQILVNKGVCPDDKPVWIEGPHMYRIGEDYFLMPAEGGTGDWHSEVVFRASSPWGPFLPWEQNPILTQRTLPADRPNAVTCAGHADLVQTKEGDWWAVFLACRPLAEGFENLGRETFLMPVRWSDDGFPYMTRGDETVPLLLQREGVQRGENVTFGNFAVRDDFESNTLDMQWLTLRGDAKDLYSLTSHPNSLTLRCAAVSTAERATPAFVGRRLQHHKFEAATRMHFRPNNERETAGLLLFKDETHQYFLALHAADGERCLSLYQISATGAAPLATTVLPADSETIDLRVSSTGPAFSFSYATAEGAWQTLIDGVDAGYLSTAVADGFTGTLVGLYATSKE